MKEIWKYVEGYNNSYQISNTGNIRRIYKNGNIKYLKLCIFNGYYYVSLWKNNYGKNYLVHRLVAKHFLKNYNSKPQVNHIDGNKLNNVVNNLEWCTQKENVNHAIKTGLTLNLGEDNNASKLNVNQVYTIYFMLKYTKLSQSKISNIYNVSKTAISLINRKINWKYLKLN